MPSNRSESEQGHRSSNRNRQVTYAFGTVLLLLVGAAVFWKLRGASMYQQWMNNRLMDKAEQYLKAGKFPDATTAARRLFRQDPSNIRAMKVLAQVAEWMRRRDAMAWRKQIADLDSGHPENLIDLANTAIQFNDLTMARDALARFPEGLRDSNFYYNQAAGAVFFGFRDMVRSEHHFAQAARLQPTNELAQMNLARLRIQSSDDRLRTQARETLSRIPASSPNYGTAVGILARDFIARGDIKGAGTYTRILVNSTNTPFSERILHLTHLKTVEPDEFKVQLEKFKAAALDNSEDLTQLITWMNMEGMAPQALAWVQSQPLDKFKSPTTGLAVAELYAVLRDWLGLRNWIRRADWQMVAQGLRYAYEARAVFNLPRTEQSATEVNGLWKKALDVAGDLPEQLQVLADAAVAWGMNEQWEQCWWRVANGNVAQENALMILLRNYMLNDNTFGQYRVARRLLTLDPRDLTAKNNTVYFGLLLQLDSPDLPTLAEELYQAAPTNPNFVATYALALFRKDPNLAREAIEKLEQLPAKDLEIGGVALTYGYILAHAGDRDKARQYLRKADGTKMLPEEQKLFDEAKVLARL